MICKRRMLILFVAIVFLPALSLNASSARGQVPLMPSEQIIVRTDFEHDFPSIDTSDFTLVDDVALDGHHSLMGSIENPNRACFLTIPYAAKKGRQVNVSFFVRSDKGSACAVFWTRKNSKTKTPLARVPNVSRGRWTEVKCSRAFQTDEVGLIQIVAPSSYGAPAGRAWIDKLLVTESDAPASIEWPDHVVDFPAIAAGGNGTIYMATLERPKLGRAIGVYKYDGTRRSRLCLLEPKCVTGVSAPAVAATDDGCLVVFGAERDDRWRLCYASVVESSSVSPACRFIECGGVSNISPALAAANGRTVIVWESNAPGHRAILACGLDKNRPGEVECISEEGVNSYNPSIVALEDGSMFAAWDAAKGGNIDIYGAELKEGKWGRPGRITSDARIERYPSLASWRNQIWVAWQAQSYSGITVNNITEQRIVVARLDGARLSAPVNLFETLSGTDSLLLRPRITFSPKGALLVTARKSAGQQDGWFPMLWTCSGREWSGPRSLASQVGRWRPAPVIWTEKGCFAAVQLDDVPHNRAQQGINDDWHSTVDLVRLPDVGREPAGTEPLVMPESEFSLSKAMDMVAADLPRQTMRHNGKDLTLFWGDLHAHTDISICGRSINQPGHDLFANRRDIEKLDFCALTDHGFDFDNPRWAYNGEQTRNNHDPGRFVTFLGQEWTSSKNPPGEGVKHNRYGHHNLIYLDPYYHEFHDSFDADISPTELWGRLDGVEFVCIPHQLADWQHKGGGNPPTDWTHHHEYHQPVAEIFQARGSYEYLGCPRQAPNGAPFHGNYLQDAWAKGIVIGTIASPDHSGGKGKAGVWAEEFTRQSILQAIHARHTFGTSGAKMTMRFSADFRGGTALMGDKVARPQGAINFRVGGNALRNVRQVVIFRNNELVHTREVSGKEFSLEWTDSDPPEEQLLWYYARFQAADEELAWSSPIWFGE